MVGLVFGAFGECSQSVDLLLESSGKSIGEQGFAHQQNRDPGSSQLGVLASRSQLELGTEIAAYSPSWPRASFG